MNNEVNEEKKSKTGLIIIIIILLLLIVFAVLYFVLRKDGEAIPNNNGNNTQEPDNTNKVPTPSNNTVEYDYKDGVLTTIVDEEGKPVQTDFVIDGIILVGNRHSYAGLDAGAEGVVTKLVEQGYKKEGINSSFYLNEWIEFYIDTKYNGSNDDVKILITPHKTVEEYLKMSYAELEELANNNGGYVIEYKTPETENYKYVGNGYVNIDYPEGKYDILFTYKEKLAYFINVDLMKEPTE